MQTLTVTAPNVYRFVNSFVLTSEDIVTMVEKKERTTATQKWRELKIQTVPALAHRRQVNFI